MRTSSETAIIDESSRPVVLETAIAVLIKAHRTIRVSRVATLGLLLPLLAGTSATAQDHLIRPSQSGFNRSDAADRSTISSRQSTSLTPNIFNDDPFLRSRPVSPFATSSPISSPTDPVLGPAVAPEKYRARGQRSPYNVRVGPVTFRFGAGLRAEYNDNIGISSSGEGRLSDFIVTPQIYMDGHWPISKLNDLSLRLGFGYTAYLGNPELNSFSQSFELVPGFTALSFRVKIRDVYIEFYDRPAVQHDPTDLLTLREGITYDRFNNSAGVNLTWDLNDVVFKAGFNRSDTIPFRSEFDFLHRATNTLLASVTFRLTDTTSAGLESSASLISYKDNFQNDGVSYNAGPFVETQLTRSVRLSVAGGFQGLYFEEGGRNQDRSDLTSYYWNISLSHRLNRFVSQSFSLGHEADLGTNSNFVVTDFFRHHVTWNIFRRVSLGTDAFFDIAEESGGIQAQEFRSIGFAISLGYTLSERASLGAFYSFVARDAGGQRGDRDRASDYRQNRVGINLVYAF